MIEGSARGNPTPGLESLSVAELSAWAPNLVPVLKAMGIPIIANEGASLRFLCEEAGVNPADVFRAMASPEVDATQHSLHVQSMTIVAGQDKTRQPEPVRELVIRRGEIVALVGPTGSGKSQILSDVELLSCGDSPSGRMILLDGASPPEEMRWSPAFRPVAQISQSMNFLLDLTVGHFLEMHTAIRTSDDAEVLKERVVHAACTLCGEPFGLEQQLVSLSGGQSRSLMIADAVLVSRTPIVLVDEIENAGISRDRAMKFLAGEGKIVLIATHDPLLALRADKRVVLRNGAMLRIIERSEKEQGILSWLEDTEEKYTTLRNALRSGQQLSTP